MSAETDSPALETELALPVEIIEIIFRYVDASEGVGMGKTDNLFSSVWF
jgi:hypothetical protein